ncbi:unnamed protein product, partial [Vitis vinifera]|uniref:Uncharacterized protein n=1 Tax=Vitis vinifera TaxID=29760 RepID=E0CRM0_VITVI
MLLDAIKAAAGYNKGCCWDLFEIVVWKRKKNKGKKLEKKNRVIEAMRSWTLKIVKNGEREENMRKV